MQSDDDLIQRNCEIDNTQNPSTNADGKISQHTPSLSIWLNNIFSVLPINNIVLLDAGHVFNPD